MIGTVGGIGECECRGSSGWRTVLIGGCIWMFHRLRYNGEQGMVHGQYGMVRIRDGIRSRFGALFHRHDLHLIQTVLDQSILCMESTQFLLKMMIESLVKLV